jgi:hypothetical protein
MAYISYTLFQQTQQTQSRGHTKRERGRIKYAQSNNQNIQTFHMLCSYAMQSSSVQSSPIQPNTMHTQVHRWVLYIIQPLLLLECSSDTPMRTRCPLTVMKVSASHSYQTLRSSVCRHMETVM